MCDRYNFDETALMYELLPNQTLASRPVPGKKISKTRITVGLLTNADASHQYKPTIIHKYRRPRCFPKSFDPDAVVDYFYNNKAWMTQREFNKIVKRFDRDRRLAGRKVILIVDNASSHLTTDQLNLTNVTVYFLRPNTTTKLQPLDAGIIANVKCHYRHLLCKWIVDRIDAGHCGPHKVTVLQAMQWIIQAWKLVKPSTIRNCWRHTGILHKPPTTQSSPDSGSSDEDDDVPLSTMTDPLDDLPLSELRNLIQKISPDDDLATEQYVNIDNDVPTEADMDLDDIIESVTDSVETEDNEQAEDETEAEIPPLSDKDAQSLLQNYLQYWMTNMKNTPSDQEMLNSLLGHIRRVDENIAQKRSQSSITSFFKPA